MVSFPYIKKSRNQYFSKYNYFTFSSQFLVGYVGDNHDMKITRGFPGSDGKESACNAGDTGLIPGSGRSPGEENGNPHQYSCLNNPMDRGA